MDESSLYSASVIESVKDTLRKSIIMLLNNRGFNMGHNNNHAGMHMIWHRHFGIYDGYEYYDRYTDMIAEQKWKKSVQLTTNANKVKTEIHKTEAQMVPEGNTPVEITTPSTPNSNKIERKKYRGSNNNIKSTYGTAEVIDIEHFFNGYVMANIMIIAMKKKKDICLILDECEDLMFQDVRTNPSPDSFDSWMTKLEPVMVFLSLLADRLDCNVFEFFINDEKNRRKFAYSLLDFVRTEKSFWGEVEKSGNATFCIDGFDYIYNMVNSEERKEALKNVTSINSLFPDMPLTFKKQVFSDGTLNYAVSFGSTSVKAFSQYDYCMKGAYLFEEETGQLCDFIEEVISKHPEWLENEE